MTLVTKPNKPELTPLQRAFLALEETQARLAHAEGALREPIAIIGLGCRVPGADDPGGFWRLLRDGVDAIGPIPADRWDVDAIYDPDPEAVGRIATRAGGFIGDVRGFDPALFGITRREAQGMDPQQRLLLEVGWEALEHAGQPPDRLSRSATGVYVGVTGSDWAYLQFKTGDRGLLDAHFASGIAHSIVSGRLSYLLGLQGPALTIDTACSSSLVAVHLACQALRAGDCRMALAGGVNLILSPDPYIALSRSRMLAPDGRCKTFDAAADGFARGEGCGMVVLKKLSDAQADGDRILAVIRGSAINQDGPSSGLTAPNGPAQAAVIREALARAGVVPRQVGYIEAHGTGTQLGDPLEVQALGEVFGLGRSAAQPLFIGSVKTNVGHLEAAAGVTGLIKLVLALGERQLPPHLHFRQPSPHIAWNDWPVRVPTTLMPWEPIDGRRIAGVSSFGFSGTNAHVVVEEAPPAADFTPAPERAQLFVLSGRDEAALRAMAARHAEAIAAMPGARLGALCFSAATGRAHLAHRATVVARSVDELVARLAALALGEAAEGVRTARLARRDPPRVTFLFTGQGAQYAGMARRLDETQPVFHRALDECAAVLDTRLAQPLRALLAAPAETSRLDETGFTQPALFAVEYALASLWRAWGVEPAVLMGHSVGELVAACLGGVMTLPDALALIAERGRLMQSLPAGGAMAAVFAPEAEVATALALHAAVAIAAQNGPAQTVISGRADAVQALCDEFTACGLRVQRLPVSHAFHSPLVEPVLAEFEAAVARVPLATPALRIVSNLSGRLADAREITTPAYWRRHLREAVRFADGLNTLAGLNVDVCLEVGPQPTLTAFAQATFDAHPEGPRPALVASLRKGCDDLEQLDEALAALYLAGAPIDWRAVWAAAPQPRLDLPGYAFQREPLWFPQRPAARGHAGGHPLLGSRQRAALRDVVIFESVLRATDLPFIDDHRVLGQAILPATCFLELALAAGRQVLGGRCEVQDLALLEPLRWAGDEARIVQVVLRPHGDATALEVLSTAGDDAPWQRHAEGRVAAAQPLPAAEPRDAVAARCAVRIEAAEHQVALAARGLVFGPSLHGVRHILRGEGEALGEIVLPPPAVAGRGSYECHPALLDACLQVLSAAMVGTDGRDLAGGRAWLPLAIGTLQLVRLPAGSVWSHARLLPGSGAGLLKGEITLYDADGVLGALRGISLRAAVAEAGAGATPFHKIAWESLPAADTAWMPAPAALDAAAGPALPALAREHGLDAYQQAFVALESLSASWVAAAFDALGWRPVAGQTVRRDALARQLGVIPLYERLVGRLLDVLAEEGHLAVTAEGWQMRTPWPRHDAAALQVQAQALLQRHPDSTARLTLAARCGPQLAGILRGTVDPLAQLFPDGSTALAESLYRDAPEARVFNHLVREAVRQVLAARPADWALRVLEVGGGTGGTTAWVAPELSAAQTEYLFTDIGPSMVARAREKFAAHAFMQFQTLDLEQPPEAQGLAGRRFNLILASNVVHATADLRQTLGRLRSLLVPGGLLLMLEVAGLERWIDITFGLTEGWWRFTDVALRRDYPLLNRGDWLDLLHGEGFEASAVGAPDARSREVLLAARRPLATVADPWPQAGRWLLVGEGGALGIALAAQLRAAGRSVDVLAGTGTASGDEAAVRREVDAWLAAPGRVAGVVHLAALGLPAPAEAAPTLLDAQRTSLGSLLGVVQALAGRAYDAGATPRLWLATRGAVAADAAPLALAQAPLWGLARTLVLEHPELRCTRVDLDPGASDEAAAEALAERLRDDGTEDQLAQRGGGWRVARLRAIEARPATVTPMRLEKGHNGLIDELALVPMARRAPGPGEVQIRVVASGLNFRDLMNVLAMRDDPEPLGGECAGRVVAVGEGVTGFAPGDAVLAIAEASLATHAVTAAALVRPLPAGVGFAEAATRPFAFMTAWHALHTLGDIRPGETVLVHAGTGGVGMAALQIAQAAGAHVLATAGSDDKRTLLRALGVAQVFDSRSLAFADGVLAATGGRGADLVLNSLAGDFIAASVRCLAPDGRFLEIGKRDIWRPERFAAERPAGRYHAIDLAAMRYQDPAGTAALLDRVLAEVAAGRLRPLPLQTFALARAAEGFRCMAMARHVGKVVLVDVDAQAAAMDALRPDATYLVTGGLTGLGLLTAGRLVVRGARHLLLVGRRAPGAAALAEIARLREAGATVKVQQVDVADPAAVRRLMAGVDTAAPLRGVVHSAGLLEDGALLHQTWPRFVRPLGSKVDGAWALHAATCHLPLDFFVLYSSLASVFGSYGQANHAAANAFIDALAQYRQAQGLPALSIAWGAWSEVGAAAERQVDKHVGAQGLDVIEPQRGLAWLEQLMASGEAQVAVTPVRWEAFLAGERATVPFFSHCRPQRGREAAADSAAPAAAPAATLAADLAAATPARRQALLLGFVGDHVARVIGAPNREAIDPRQPLNELGLDSLMAVELRNRLGSGLGLQRSLPATLVFDHPTLEALAAVLERELLGLAAAAPAAPEPPADAVVAIDDMSDEEIDQLFAKKLGKT